jgi:hypothetical protein
MKLTIAAEIYTKSLIRLHSIISSKGWYEIDSVHGSDVMVGGMGDNWGQNSVGSNIWVVTYSAWGDPITTTYTEHVRLFGMSHTMSIIHNAYENEGAEGKSRLYPMNMAMEPSLYWSVVYHFINDANFAEDDAPTIEDLLQLMFPGKDWKFLQLNPECTADSD